LKFRQQVSTQVSELTLQNRDFEKLMSLSTRNANIFLNPKFFYCDAKRLHSWARCFLWRQNNPEVNYSPIRISGGECFWRRYHALGNNKIEKIEMGGACSTYGGRERCVQGSGGET
jgi:hypothetical protein